MSDSIESGRRSAREDLLIVCGDHRLSRPLIDRLSLKRDRTSSGPALYSTPGTLLVESSGGRLAAAATTGFLLGMAGHGPNVRAFHLGSALPAAASSRVGGSLVLVNRVCDGETGREYFPDILIRHEFREAGCCTQEGARENQMPQIPVDREGLRADFELVDGELSGFAAAALSLLAPHQVYCLAAVCERTELEPVIERNVAPLVRLIEATKALCAPEQRALEERDRELLERTETVLRLTSTQRSTLHELAARYVARHREEGLPSLLDEATKSAAAGGKQGRNGLFERIKGVLSS